MSENSEILINTYKRTANPMYNLLVVLIIINIMVKSALRSGAYYTTRKDIVLLCINIAIIIMMCIHVSTAC